MKQSAFAPGFRLSVRDGLVFVAGIGGTIVLSIFIWWWGFVVGFVVGHFFLFCNVIRLARPLELPWGAVFVALPAATIALETPGWMATALLSLVVTVTVVVVEMRKPSYHGVGWRWINPDLPAWWEARMGKQIGC